MDPPRREILGILIDFDVRTFIYMLKFSTCADFSDEVSYVHESDVIPKYILWTMFCLTVTKCNQVASTQHLSKLLRNQIQNHFVFSKEGDRYNNYMSENIPHRSTYSVL